ncbi:hypothetical protein ACWCY1_31815 [Streptomyces goshikiensis]|uniref:hypothetical protein n=1 Tax=Streptomyces goshikiensis TaxID=1942 RepID=UPI002AE0AC4D|nr:hypothetical protein [Streptomyces goshikiensis]
MDGIVLWMFSELGDLDVFGERFEAKMSHRLRASRFPSRTPSTDWDPASSFN